MPLNIIVAEHGLFFLKWLYSNIGNKVNYDIKYNSGKPIE
ncbi:hypothetical protein BH18THE2_BH18THE2_30800 [soil metagenome]|jgi:hypothetical protein